jgi:polyisoprenoid-binding protein YceI
MEHRAAALSSFHATDRVVTMGRSREVVRLWQPWTEEQMTGMGRGLSVSVVAVAVLSVAVAAVGQQAVPAAAVAAGGQQAVPAAGQAAELPARSVVAQASVERYEIDASHSNVDFVVRHLGVASVRGQFTKFSGHVMVDAADVTRSTVSVTIEAGSVDTRNQRRDDHLRSADFFEAERFPTLTFVGRRVEVEGGEHVLVGDLTIRDVTREVRIPFEMTGPVSMGEGQKRMGAEGTLRVNRFDYGLRWNRITEAVQVVGDEVRIELSISAVARAG